MEVEAMQFVMGYSLSVLRYQYKRTRWIVILLSRSKSSLPPFSKGGRGDLCR